jgi:hypothetical protein
VNITVKSQSKLSRIASINHAIECNLSNDDKEATIKLASDLDRKTVPFKDFVLYLSDEMVNTPVGLLHQMPNGD